MGRFLFTDGRCDRARVWASLRLDGELSELERVLLAAHLRRCDECAGFVAGMDASTDLLRAAPYEAPERRFLVPARPATVWGKRLAARAALAAALAGLAVGLGVLAGPIVRGSERPAPPPPFENVALVTQTSQHELGLQTKLRSLGETAPNRLLPASRIRGNL